MGYKMIEITQDKVETLNENIEKGLRYIGKAMQCIDEMREETGKMGERRGMRYGNRYGMRGGYGRMGMRDDGMEDDAEMRGHEDMGMRGGMGYRDPYYY